MAVGEAWDATDIVANYVDGKFDFCFEFDLAQYIFSAVTSNSPNYIRSKMQELKDAYPYHQYGTFLTNHDQNRIFSALGQSVTNSKLAASVYLTLPGIPFLYYGEEIGMLGSKPDENIRRPMQWDDSPNGGFTSGNPWHQLNSNYANYNVELEQDDTNSLWSRYNQLIQIRNREVALTKGTYQAIDASNNLVLAYIREYQGEAVMVVHNFSNTARSDIQLNTTISNLMEGNYSALDLTGKVDSITPLDVLVDGQIDGWLPIPD